MSAITVNNKPSNIEHLITTHTELENLTKSMAPMPDEAMNRLTDAIFVVRERILALLPTSSESISAAVLAPFIDQLMEDAA
ncbi:MULTISPECIES: hypothetical protein [unclassified Mesorhizobium]|uniref:hypothetical protein n=1 Tax=unclassified Mesorhizobium TaxID=325217 RepID=UPI0030143F9E